MRFAYLIMAHDNEEQLRTLIDLLDYPENDIYLHIDKKSSIKKAQFETKNAKLKVYTRFSVYYADLSQTKCQMFLLGEAIKEYHDYYHLISGHDLPIKSHDQIQDFFRENKGKQFIHFEGDDYCMKEKCRYYHFLAPIISRCTNAFIRNKIWRIENGILAFQKKKGVTRLFYCGANWYSITHEFAKEFCFYSKEIIRKVRWTMSSDEYVLQTFYRTMAKGQYELFAETKESGDYHGAAREIDWYRGSPYVWRNEDYNQLVKSERMFARKFDQRVDAQIIKRIVELVK